MSKPVVRCSTDSSGSDIDFFVLAEDVAQRVGDLADRRARLDRLHDRRDQVGSRRGRRSRRRRAPLAMRPGPARRGRRRRARPAAARCPGSIASTSMPARLVGREAVDADDDRLAGVDALLGAVGGLLDLALDQAAARSPPACRPRRRCARASRCASRSIAVGGMLDRPRAAERVDRVRDAALARDDLLGAQRDARRLLGRQRRAPRRARCSAATACRRAPPPAPGARRARCCCRAAARSACCRRSGCGSGAAARAGWSRRSGRA